MAREEITREEIERRVKVIVADQLGVDSDDLTPETHLEKDLSADSLDGVEIIMEIEDEFEISIPDEEAQKIKTIGAAVKLVESKMKNIKV